jgi:3-oxoacyl-[acyl-carrier protein] reductase
MKTILITAGSHGIGRALAQDLGQDNQIVISYRGHKEEAHALADSLPHAIAYQADLEEPSSVENLMREAEKHFESVDVLIHCASTIPVATLDETDLAIWNEAMTSNLTTAFNTFKAVLPAMRAQKWGRIVAFVDSGIWANTPYTGLCAYHCAKAGLLQLVRTVAKQEVANGITVNAIAPGTVEHSEPKPPKKSMPLGRWITLEEVVAAVKNVISEEAGVTTGAMIPVTGGVGL